MRTACVVLMLAAMALGQKAETTPDLTLQTSGTTIGNLYIMAPEIGNVAVTCEAWKPKPTKCSIMEGKTLDDLTAAMLNWSHEQGAEIRGLQDENDRWIAYIDILQRQLQESKALAKSKKRSSGKGPAKD